VGSDLRRETAPAAGGDLALAWTLVPPGALAWLALLQMGRRADEPRWQRFAAVYGGLAGLGGEQALTGHLTHALGWWMLSWVLSTLHALALRGRYHARLRTLADPQLELAEERLRRREQAVRLAARDPRKARALGVGRPDLEDAYHAGLVDVNGAPATVLGALPGYDAELAERTVALRGDAGGFSSVEELGALLDLPAGQVEALRDHVVFL
jgi:hypothetical protein